MFIYKAKNILLISLINLSYFSINAFSLETNPSCNISDINLIKEYASKINKIDILETSCKGNSNSNINNSLYFKYTFTTKTNKFSCYIYGKSNIISTNNTTNIPQLKCDIDNKTSESSWVEYFVQYDKYMQATKRVLDNWNQLPAIKLAPLPIKNEMDFYEIAVFTNYPYKKGSSGSLPKGIQVWFTNAADMKETCKNVIKKERIEKRNLGLRYSQLLGIPPQAPNETARFFAFMKVPAILAKPDIDYQGTNNTFTSFKGPGIFRPCASTFMNPTAANCNTIDRIPIGEVSLRKEISKDDKISTNLLISSTLTKWTAYQFLKRYFAHDGYTECPWTGRGYTYDWGTEKRYHYGMSEYILEQKSNYSVYNIKSVEEFSADCSDL
ncbi:hypothetical protein ACWNT8_10195 [Pigmentibacter ruber]